MKALVIFSGGQDSTTCLGWAMKKYESVEAITFKYGQKHSVEIEQSKKICEMNDIHQHIIDISFFGEIVDSALTSNGNVNESHARLKHLPASFVPNRNAMFITIAHALAQKIGADILVTGVSQTDYSGYPDCREDFIEKIEAALTSGSDSNIRIATPLINKDKKETWQLANELGILELVRDFSHTCYNGDRQHYHTWGFGCGECPACKLRAKGYREFIDSLEVPIK